MTHLPVLCAFELCVKEVVCERTPDKPEPVGEHLNGSCGLTLMWRRPEFQKEWTQFCNRTNDRRSHCLEAEMPVKGECKVAM